MSALLAAARLMLEPGSVAELRIPKTKTRKGTVSGYFDDFDKLATAAAEWDGKAPGVYVTLNAVNPDLLARSVNHLTEWAENTTPDTDIVRRRWLPIDCDPVRSSGISSTEKEHDAAIARAREIGQWLGKQGWQRPIWADSGNGGHLLYRIDLPNDSDSTQLVQRCLEALDLRFSDAAVTVDVTNHNPARIWKLYGTTAAKGDSTQERPHRVSKVLSAPPEVETVDVALLRKLAGAAPQRSTLARGGEEFDVEVFMAANNLLVKRTAPWQGGTKWVLETCPWNPEHTDDSAVIVRLPGGALSAKCHHNGCTGNDWAALRGLYEPEYERRREQRRDGASAATEEDLSGPVLVNLSRVQREEVRWLWEDRIPLGRLTGIVGDPGVGKSWLTLAVGAAVTKGTALPGPESSGEPGRVLLLTAEDGLADTVVARMDDMGADLERVRVLTAVRDAKGNERHPSLLTDIPDMEKALADGGYKLVIIDPLNAYLGVNLDTHRDAALRSALTPLAAMAERWGVAVLFVQHLNKGQRDRAIYRAQGSIAVVAASRVVHLVGVNPDDESERVFHNIKNNLAKPPPALAFQLTEGRFLWRGESTVTEAALLRADEDEETRSALDEAEHVLRIILADGPVAAKKVKSEAHEAGVSERTLRRAKATLGVDIDRCGETGRQGGGMFVWSLPSVLMAKPPVPVNLATKTLPDTKQAKSTSAIGPENIDEGQRLYARSLWEGQGRPASVRLSEGKMATDPGKLIDSGNADDLAALIAGLETS